MVELNVDYEMYSRQHTELRRWAALVIMTALSRMPWLLSRGSSIS